MKKHLLYLLAISVILGNGCQRRRASKAAITRPLEVFNQMYPAIGLPKTVNGIMKPVQRWIYQQYFIG